MDRLADILTFFRMFVRRSEVLSSASTQGIVNMRTQVPLGKVMLAESFGTFLLVFFGCGAVHAAVLMSAQAGLWQVAIVWGLAINLDPIGDR